MKLDNKTKTLLLNPEQRWEWIKYQLRILGSSVAKVARENNISRQALTQVKCSPYPKGESHLAKALGLHPADLFKERYNQHGLPNRGHLRVVHATPKEAVKSSTSDTACNVNQAAAN